MSSLIGFPGVSPYIASKHAVMGLTRSAALDYAKQGIRINAINPGMIATEMMERLADGSGSTADGFASTVPMGRMGQAEEIAQAVVFSALMLPAMVFRWVQEYGPELDKRCRPHLRLTNDSWRVDKTYIKVKGKSKYLYRAVDSAGNTLDFLLTAKRDAAAAKRFFRKTLKAIHTSSPRVITMDKNPAYPKALDSLTAKKELPKKVKLRQRKYLNNIVEQDHRGIKRLVKPGMGFGSFNTARRTIKGYEMMNMMRKGQIKDVEKGAVQKRVKFINQVFGVAA